jgi:hypothetical protein
LKSNEICALAVERKYPGIVGRWGFVDGKNYRVEKPTNALLQNAMFNGWLQQTFVTGVFCFAADGTVVWGKHNVVGSWNDGEVSRRSLQEKLKSEACNLPNHGVVADTAFPVCGELAGCIMTPLKEGEFERVQPPELRLIVTAISRMIISLRQACEWGNGIRRKGLSKIA